jgi:hypothetical protein
MLIVVVFLAVFLSACTARQATEIDRSEAPDIPWWTKLDFTPKDSAIRGVPVEKLDPSWHRASELKKPEVPQKALYNGVDMMDEEDVHFSIEEDFNQDGILDLATAGVYEAKTGTRGNFVLILTKEPSGGWRTVFLDFGAETAGFLALRWRDGILEVWPCMECDAVNLLRWSARFKEYIWVPAWGSHRFTVAEIAENEESLKQNPGEEETLSILAWVYSTYPEYRTDTALRRRALDYVEKAKRPYYYPEAVGAALYANGKLAEGDEIFDQAIRRAADGLKPYYRETKENLREMYFPKKN